MPEPNGQHGEDGPLVRWGKVIDQTRCIGCHACTTACKSENEVPLAVTRTYVKYVEVGEFPQAQRLFQVTRCNQCEAAPCVTACPTSAMFRRPDGIVDFDKSACIGCKACIAACPYDAIFINPDDHSAEKCNFCAHRLEVGLQPSCVVVCPTEAILVGNLNDPDSAVSRIVNRAAVHVRRPEKETGPKLFYRQGHQATLDPLAARRPEGNLFLWSEQPDLPQHVNSGHPTRPNSSAATLLAYDVAHSMPWDWRVSLYTWTKGIASGAYLAALGLALAGPLSWASPVWLWAAPLLGGIFLALTGALLIWDLEHPRRFYYLFTRPQWRSWLVRGAVLITGYALVLAAHLVAASLGMPAATGWLALLGAPLAAGVAAYTGYLFAQAKGRDLWQNPLSPVHFVVKGLLVGSCALFVPALLLDPWVAPGLLALIAATSLLHLLLLLADASITHVTAHARLAAHEMTRGRYRLHFRWGILLVAIGLAAPWLGVWVVLMPALGVLSHEHAYVQAGQSVPLA